MNYSIVVLVGDGIGLEVMVVVEIVLDVVSEKFGFILICYYYVIGGVVIDEFG